MLLWLFIFGIILIVLSVVTFYYKDSNKGLLALAIILLVIGICLLMYGAIGESDDDYDYDY
ncbi:MAG: hypothetical protein Dasosvirus6_10 [Dasosvirus sp.]|uniref:Uncharacterized protein n=1 Tax=Dasosvirus sp. TaxID=2487764 RepID=A0A3G4ZRM2_9VIRU|nr:MAG: hypothetical protein Dasosvirus6_10 [Dasosvirus sp.]